MPKQTHRMDLPNGPEIKLRPIERLDKNTARVEIEAPDGRRWRLDIEEEGDYALVGSWDSDGNLADVPLPEWFDEVRHRLDT